MNTNIQRSAQVAGELGLLVDEIWLNYAAFISRSTEVSPQNVALENVLFKMEALIQARHIARQRELAHCRKSAALQAFKSADAKT